jgi:hypothetical protein
MANIVADVIPQRLAECKSFTKIINIPATASGVSNGGTGYVVSGGTIVELDDALNSHAWTPNHLEITFMPVSASIYNTNISSSGYSNTGYMWVHPWGSDMQASSTFRGMHPDNTLATGAAAYGKIALLGQKMVWDFPIDGNVYQIQLFNRYGGAVVAYINYSLQKYYDESGTCGS